jgi:hypothetical protein
VVGESMEALENVLIWIGYVETCLGERYQYFFAIILSTNVIRTTESQNKLPSPPATGTFQEKKLIAIKELSYERPETWLARQR